MFLGCEARLSHNIHWFMFQQYGARQTATAAGPLKPQLRTLHTVACHVQTTVHKCVVATAITTQSYSLEETTVIWEVHVHVHHCNIAPTDISDISFGSLPNSQSFSNGPFVLVPFITSMAWYQHLCFWAFVTIIYWWSKSMYCVRACST